MFLGRVIGFVTATIKIPEFEGLKLLWVQPICRNGSPSGKAIVACDATQAGIGDRVFVVDSREAAFALPDHATPTDATIAGIVEYLEPSTDLESAK
ncbi:EutN/CcmL family microcompartment protein [Alkalispirochaeta alkalica]|uniref:EutN/CcmL family microcompartment protein n=1 Tax=Alkalispirochaeta alkalica TaxID=46356 RepID=UPI00037A4715|nr:EutN/CcmL family microcompartment protein [Alkalispirochaeta alkalica]